MGLDRAINKVYISSTYKDLLDYREAVITTLDKHFRVINMERYVAAPIDPLEKCLQDVEDCDLYILIIGRTYGSVDKKSGLSFTHCEFQKARKAEKLILAFIMKSSNRDLVNKLAFIKIVNRLFIDKSNRLTKFIEEVKDYTLVHPIDFTDKSDLLRQVYESTLSLLKPNLRKKINSDRKLLINRESQTADFVHVLSKEARFYVYQLQGNENHLCSSLVQRFAKFELNIDKTIAINLTDFANCDYKLFKIKVIQHIGRNLKLKNYLHETIGSFLNQLIEEEKKIQVLETIITTPLEYTEYFRYFNDLLEDFEQAVKNSACKLIWFIILEFPDRTSLPIAKVKVNYLPDLDKIHRRDIDYWFRSNVEDDDEIAKSLRNLFFHHTELASEPIEMKEAQSGIRTFINQYNEIDDINPLKILLKKHDVYFKRYRF